MTLRFGLRLSELRQLLCVAGMDSEVTRRTRQTAIDELLKGTVLGIGDERIAFSELLARTKSGFGTASSDTNKSSGSVSSGTKDCGPEQRELRVEFNELALATNSELCQMGIKWLVGMFTAQSISRGAVPVDAPNWVQALGSVVQNATAVHWTALAQLRTTLDLCRRIMPITAPTSLDHIDT